MIDRPLLPHRQYSDTTVIIPANQRMRTYRIVNANELEFRSRLPVQRHVEVARKDLPFRPVVEFHKVTFGMRSDLHVCQRWCLREVPPQESDTALEPSDCYPLDRLGVAISPTEKSSRSAYHVAASNVSICTFLSRDRRYLLASLRPDRAGADSQARISRLFANPRRQIDGLRHCRQGDEKRQRGVPRRRQ